MSQKAVFVRVDGNLIQEVFNTVPDYDDACQICNDNGWDGTEDRSSDYYNVEYEWIDIGEGESGLDTFIDDKTLLHIYDCPDYADLIKEQYALDVESIESGEIEVMIDDLIDNA